MPQQPKRYRLGAGYVYLVSEGEHGEGSAPTHAFESLGLAKLYVQKHYRTEVVAVAGKEGVWKGFDKRAGTPNYVDLVWVHRLVVRDKVPGQRRDDPPIEIKEEDGE